MMRGFAHVNYYPLNVATTGSRTVSSRRDFSIDIFMSFLLVLRDVQGSSFDFYKYTNLVLACKVSTC